MCAQYRGYKDLSDRELLNLLVSENTTSYLLQKHSSLESILLNTYPQELKRVNGIGRKKCARILAVAEICHRIFRGEASKRRTIKCAEDVFEINKDMMYLKQEEVRAIYLNVKNGIIKIETISVGTTTSSLLSPKEVFSRAIKLMTEAVIVVHNHPSGNAQIPSKDDIKITEKLKKTGKTIGINVLDHIIIGRGNFLSLKEYTGD